MSKHPNRLPFGGVMTRVGLPSDKPPGGSTGHRTLITRQAALEALPSLLGMGVSFKTGWNSHDRRQKCGVINHAEIIGDKLRVVGHLYEKDFPEVCHAIRTLDMGMSYEADDAHVLDLSAPIWTVTALCFVGAAIVLRAAAAYETTSIKLVEDCPRS